MLKEYSSNFLEYNEAYVKDKQNLWHKRSSLSKQQYEAFVELFFIRFNEVLYQGNKLGLYKDVLWFCNLCKKVARSNDSSEKKEYFYQTINEIYIYGSYNSPPDIRLLVFYFKKVLFLSSGNFGEMQLDKLGPSIKEEQKKEMFTFIVNTIDETIKKIEESHVYKESERRGTGHFDIESYQKARELELVKRQLEYKSSKEEAQRSKGPKRQLESSV